MKKVSMGSKLLVFIANLLLRLMSVFPVQKGKVVYWARGLSVYGNASVLCQEWLKCPGTRHIYLIGHTSSAIVSGDFHGVCFVPFRSITAIFHIATCNYLIKETDVASPPLYCRSGTKVAQLWHAAGAFKKFGLDIQNRSDSLKKYRRIDANRWDFLLCSSEAITDIYAHAFQLKDKSRIYVDGLPRNDLLFSAIKERDKLKLSQGFISTKKVILFAPTFREDHAEGESFSDLIESLQTNFSHEYTICVRMHPSCRSSVVFPAGVINGSSCQSLEVLLAFTDVLITDYSSIIFDFSCLHRPMIFYAPDLDKYVKERDFYFGYDSFVPGPVCCSALRVVDEIKQYDLDCWTPRINEFQRKFNPSFDGNAASRILQKIIKL